jgi:sialidase-1
MIEVIGHHVIYENARPHVHSRHGYFPGLAKLPSGDLLCLFVLGEAFEAPNNTTVVSRSKDDGRTWQLQGNLHQKSTQICETTDALKPTLLEDGTIVAIGYRFHRHNLEQGIGIEETGGICPGDDIISRSQDEGYSWSCPEIIERTRPELLEISGPCIELRESRDLVAVSAPFKLPDGSNPSGQIGVLLRSTDHGVSWNDEKTFFRAPSQDVTPLESRVCEMQDGRLVAVVWAYDYSTDRSLPNHVVVSHDAGETWSAPINTGHCGQAANLLWLGGDLLLTIHAHREGERGLYVRLVDFSHDCWRVIDEQVIWACDFTLPGQQKMVQTFSSLKFGQPSLLRLSEEEFLATHWIIEDGQGKIHTHRLRVRAN